MAITSQQKPASSCVFAVADEVNKLVFDSQKLRSISHENSFQLIDLLEHF